jgi:hypothetical protein
MSSCFNTFTVKEESLLFPGPQQEHRFVKILNRVLKENHIDVQALGFDVDSLGTHSIWKGAASFLTSLPGGLPAASSSIRGGWSMGNVKDRYFKYMESGDQFVGQCLSLLPILTVDMAASPPFFDIVTASEDYDKVMELIKL